MLANIPAVRDNAKGTLASAISAASFTIPLSSGQGALFPNAKTSAVTFNGTSTTFQSILVLDLLGAGAVGKPIFNQTDGSMAFIKVVNTGDVVTTPLMGGIDNIWQAGDNFTVDEFVITLEKITTNDYGVESVDRREQVRIGERDTDTLEVASGGRGYNGSTPQAFDPGDHVRLLVSSPNHQRIVDYLNLLARLGETVTDLSSQASGKGASLIGIHDLAGYFAGTNVEAALQYLAANLSAPTGSSMVWWTDFPPSGWLLCQGQAVSRTTYSALFAVLVKSSTATISIASPGVIVSPVQNFLQLPKEIGAGHLGDRSRAGGGTE